MTYDQIVEFFVAMIIMMNPLGGLSIFVELSRKFSREDRKSMALSCGIAITVIMVVTIWIGEGLLSMLGITISSFRFAGGIILLLMGLSMIQAEESPVSHTSEDDTAAKGQSSIAVVPMATPVIIGPGAISTLMIASSDYPYVSYKLFLSLLCCVLAIGMTFLLYYASTIAKIIGASAMKVVTRLMGMLIMAIATGMLATGLMGLLPVLH